LDAIGELFKGAESLPAIGHGQDRVELLEPSPLNAGPVPPLGILLILRAGPVAFRLDSLG
jgi:hypothetical protein